MSKFCFKLHFSKCQAWNIEFANFDLLLCHIYIINTNTDSKPNWTWISLLLPGNNLENTGILCHKRSGNPASVLTHFEIFITKMCMKVPAIWHEKNWNLGPKNLRKPGFWYLEKLWEPCLVPFRMTSFSPFWCDRSFSLYRTTAKALSPFRHDSSSSPLWQDRRNIPFYRAKLQLPLAWWQVSAPFWHDDRSFVSVQMMAEMSSLLGHNNRSFKSPLAWQKGQVHFNMTTKAPSPFWHDKFQIPSDIIEASTFSPVYRTHFQEEGVSGICGTTCWLHNTFKILA